MARTKQVSALSETSVPEPWRSYAFVDGSQIDWWQGTTQAAGHEGDSFADGGRRRERKCQMRAGSAEIIVSHVYYGWREASSPLPTRHSGASRDPQVSEVNRSSDSEAAFSGSV